MDWSRSVSRRLHLLRRMGPQRFVSVLRTLVWLLVADLALRFLPYLSAESLLRGRPRSGARRPTEEETRALARDVEAVARYHLYPIHCLRRALVLRRFLSQRGLETEVRFGVRKEGGRIEAHAWLEHEGRSLDPRSMQAGYARLEDPRLAAAIQDSK